MSSRGNPVEEVEYRLVFIVSKSTKALVVPTEKGDRLPTAHIPQNVRIARELQKIIRDRWRLDAIFLDFLPAEDGHLPCAIAEVPSSQPLTALLSVEIEHLLRIDLGEALHDWLRSAFKNYSFSNSPFSRLGWIDQAITWLEKTTGKRLTSKSRIEQYNGGARFALLRLTVDSLSVYWLKALLGADECELSITQALAKLYPEALPAILSVKEEWGAWLMTDAGDPLAEGSGLLISQHALCTMAELQKHTVGQTNRFLALGVLDRSPRALHSQCGELFDYIEEAMWRQTSASAPKLELKRIHQMERLAGDACLQLDDLAIPDAIVHGDMNHGNLVFDGHQCRFLDWREAYIGNPFITLEHLLLLKLCGTQHCETSSLKEVYVRRWCDVISERRIRKALKLTPVVAALAALHGRGDWLNVEHRNRPGRLRYARNIARYLDRTLQPSELSDVQSSLEVFG